MARKVLRAVTVPILSVNDFDGNIHESETESFPVEQTRTSKDGRGRTRFAEDICSLHGPADNGDPCSKFSHLPGNGRGVQQPGIAKTFLVIVRVLVKPLFLCGIVLLAFLILSKWGGSVLHFGNPLHATTGTVSTSGRHSQNSSLSAYRNFDIGRTTSSLVSVTDVR